MEQTRYTTKKVFLMSLPIFAELLLQLLVGNVDQMMISRYSQTGVAAIGNGNLLINVVIILINSMSAAATILLSQYLGAKDESRVSAVCNVAIPVIGGAGLATTLALFLFWNPLSAWLRIPAEALAEAKTYTLMVAALIVVQALYMAFAAILRSYALLRQVMLASVVMNLVNILGNSILINGRFGIPALGVVGAAVATNVSKCVGLAILVFVYCRAVRVPLRLQALRPFPAAVCRRLLFFALPAGGESLSYNLSQTFIMRFINLFGTAVVNTKVYSSIMANIAYIYSIAIAQATQIVVGYLVGGKRYDDIPRRVWTAVLISLSVSLSVTALLYCNSDFVFGLFTDDPFILKLGHQILFIEFFLEIGRSVNIAMVRCLITLGDVKVPVGSGVLSCWLIAVALSWFLGVHLGWGLAGVWVAMACDECLRGIGFVVRFVSNDWRKKVAANPDCN